MLSGATFGRGNVLALDCLKNLIRQQGTETIPHRNKQVRSDLQSYAR